MTQKPLEDDVSELSLHLADLDQFLKIQNSESPRGKVLVASSYLDEQLKEMISSFMVKESEPGILLEGFNAPIGTFSSRIKTAYCLGLINNEEYNECETLRKIRNEFAHNLRASFEDQRCLDLSKNLQLCIRFPDGSLPEIPNRFNMSAHFLITKFYNRAVYISRSRLKSREWPR